MAVRDKNIFAGRSASVQEKKIREKTAMKNKFKAGDICLKTAIYAQFSEENDACIGFAYSRYVREGLTFPSTERGCYFSEADADVPEETENL